MQIKKITCIATIGYSTLICWPRDNGPEQVVPSLFARKLHQHFLCCDGYRIDMRQYLLW